MPSESQSIMSAVEVIRREFEDCSEKNLVWDFFMIMVRENWSLLIFVCRFIEKFSIFAHTLADGHPCHLLISEAVMRSLFI